MHVLYAEEKKTLARVTELLADPAQSFEKTLRIMMATNHLGTNEHPRVHPVVAATARELLNKSENERSGVLSTAVAIARPSKLAVTSPGSGNSTLRQFAALQTARPPLRADRPWPGWHRHGSL